MTGAEAAIEDGVATEVEVVIGAGAVIGVEAAVTEAEVVIGVVVEEEEALIAETTAEAAGGEVTIVEITVEAVAEEATIAEEIVAAIAVASAASGEMAHEAVVEVGVAGVMPLLVFPGLSGKSSSFDSVSTFA